MFLQHDRLKDVTPEDLVRVAKTVLQAVEPHGRLLHSRRGARPHRRAGHAGSGDALPQLQEHGRGRARRDVRSDDPANIESRVVRVEAAERDEGRDPAEEDRPATWSTARSSCASAMRRSLAGKNAAAQFAGSLLMSGTKTKTRQQLQDEMRKLNAQIQVSGGGGGGFGGRGGGGRGGFGGGGGVSSATANIIGAGGELRGGDAARRRDAEGAGLSRGRVRSHPDGAPQDAGSVADRAHAACGGDAAAAPEPVVRRATCCIRRRAKSNSRS